MSSISLMATFVSGFHLIPSSPHGSGPSSRMRVAPIFSTFLGGDLREAELGTSRRELRNVQLEMLGHAPRQSVFQGCREWALIRSHSRAPVYDCVRNPHTAKFTFMARRIRAMATTTLAIREYSVSLINRNENMLFTPGSQRT
jgi:hypothetical protein